jgi:hypothetical protein
MNLISRCWQSFNVYLFIVKFYLKSNMYTITISVGTIDIAKTARTNHIYSIVIF